MRQTRSVLPILVLILAAALGGLAHAQKKAAGKKSGKKAPEAPAAIPAGVKAAPTDTAGWFAFNFPDNDLNLDSIDLSGFLDAPAGKHGFVTAKPDGHFYFEDGKRARFFGTNIGGASCAPPKEQAPVIAARLAKYGVSLLRLHAFDSQWGPLINPRAPNSVNLDEAALDRMDFLISELKKRGIYVYMDLLDYRQFRSADGVAHADEFTHNWAGSMKGASIFDERMIELQKDYATKLLTHRNPYTRLRYVDEPAIAVLETTNENSVFYFFRSADMSHPYYREELARRWNKWLLARYGDRAKLAAAWTEGSASSLQSQEDPVKNTVTLPFGMATQIRPEGQKGKPNPLVAAPRISDLYRFFAGIERNYYKEMRAHLKKIGVRIPIAGTNQSFFVADSKVEAEMNDWISRNQYWRHPNVQSKPPMFNNEAMVGVDIPTQRNPLSDIVSTSAVGKPQGVAEYNFPWPNEYRCEGLLMSAAYACLQDWDFFLLFSYGVEAQPLAFFNSQSDPARWGEFPAAALMFHRHDVAAARNEIHVAVTLQDALTPRPDERYAKGTNYRYLTFLSKTRNAFIEGPYRGKADAVLASGPSADAKVEGGAKVIRLPERPWEEWLYPKFVAAAQKAGLPGYERMDPSGKRLDSDTGELSLDYGKGLLTMNTARTKCALGKLGAAGALDLGGLRVECQTPFAAITATSLDGEPVGRSRRVLLTAVARAENTGFLLGAPVDANKPSGAMAWALLKDGGKPVLAEPVRAQVRLAVPEGAVAYALDPTGKRQRRLDAKAEGGMLEINPADAKSIWCEIVAQ